MLKECQWCHKEYNGRKDSRYCKDQHYKTCDNPECNNVFPIKEMKRPAKTCSKKCADTMTHINSMSAKKCQWYNCQNTFQSTKHNAIFCPKEHFDYCVICGQEFTIVNIHRPSKTCSKQCAWKLVDDVDAVIEKRKKTTRKKYGVDNPSQAPEIKEKKKQTSLKNYGIENIFLSPAVQLKAAQANGHRISKINKTWQEKIYNTTGVDFDYEINIQGNHYADLGYNNLLIDINPTISHNSTFSYPHKLNLCKKDPCEKHYPINTKKHQERALLAEDNNKILLQYFDWYNPEIFMSIIEAKLEKSPHIVYARNTVLREIPQSSANKFLLNNHLIGKSNQQSLCLGLFTKDKDELIHVQTYGKSRLNKNYEWEAIRSCSKLHYHVPGAFSKCDKYFFHKIRPKSVISYVDLSISQGHTDSLFDEWRLLRTNKPSAMWVKVFDNKTNTPIVTKDSINAGLSFVNIDDDIIDFSSALNINDNLVAVNPCSVDYPLFIKDSTARRISADRLLGFEVGEKYPRFDSSGVKITNDAVLLSEGYVKVYDAGTRTYVWSQD